jgi:hypothetical protein
MPPDSSVCPAGWSCLKYSSCSTFDSFLEAGGLFSELRCDPARLADICCDPEGAYAGFTRQEAGGGRERWPSHSSQSTSTTTEDSAQGSGEDI